MKRFAYFILLSVIVSSCTKSEPQDNTPLPDYNTLILGRWTTHNTVYKTLYNNGTVIVDSTPSTAASVTYKDNATKIWELQDGTKDTTNYRLAGNTIITTKGTLTWIDTFTTLTVSRLIFYHKRPPGTMIFNIKFTEEWTNLVK